MQDCLQYKETIAEDDGGEEEKKDGEETSVQPEAAAPLLTCDDSNHPAVLVKLRAPPPTGGRALSDRRVCLVEPPAKKARTLIDDCFLLDCLACGAPDCQFDSGTTNFKEDDGQKNEYDPCGDNLLHVPSPPRKNSVMADAVVPIKVVVGALLRSEGFFSNHKYLGSTRLEGRLMAWAKFRLKASTVDTHWKAIRQAVKETLRFMRQQCVDLMRSKFRREYFLCVSSCLMIAGG